MAVGISAGTTTSALAQLLSAGPRITVVTNSVPVADVVHQSASPTALAGALTPAKAVPVLLFPSAR